jgi:hypothetical protein
MPLKIRKPTERSEGTIGTKSALRSKMSGPEQGKRLTKLEEATRLKKLKYAKALKKLRE